MYWKPQNKAAQRKFKGIALINKTDKQHDIEQRQKERCFLEYVCNLATGDRDRFFVMYEKKHGQAALQKLKSYAREVWKLSQKDKKRAV